MSGFSEVTFELRLEGGEEASHGETAWGGSVPGTFKEQHAPVWLPPGECAEENDAGEVIGGQIT